VSFWRQRWNIAAVPGPAATAVFAAMTGVNLHLDARADSALVTL
jgi:hypothetical protein